MLTPWVKIMNSLLNVLTLPSLWTSEKKKKEKKENLIHEGCRGLPLFSKNDCP